MGSPFRRTVTITPAEYKEMCDYAKTQGRSFSNFVLHAMRYYRRMHDLKGRPAKVSRGPATED